MQALKHPFRFPAASGHSTDFALDVLLPLHFLYLLAYFVRCAVCSQAVLLVCVYLCKFYDVLFQAIDECRNVYMYSYIPGVSLLITCHVHVHVCVCVRVLIAAQGLDIHVHMN